MHFDYHSDAVHYIVPRGVVEVTYPHGVLSYYILYKRPASQQSGYAVCRVRRVTNPRAAEDFEPALIDVEDILATCMTLDAAKAWVALHADELYASWKLAPAQGDDHDATH
jgi:hypothetical protein